MVGIKRPALMVAQNAIALGPLPPVVAPRLTGVLRMGCVPSDSRPRQRHAVAKPLVQRVRHDHGTGTPCFNLSRYGCCGSNNDQ